MREGRTGRRSGLRSLARQAAWYARASRLRQGHGYTQPMFKRIHTRTRSSMGTTVCLCVGGRGRALCTKSGTIVAPGSPFGWASCATPGVAPTSARPRRERRDAQRRSEAGRAGGNPATEPNGQIRKGAPMSRAGSEASQPEGCRQGAPLLDYSPGAWAGFPNPGGWGVWCGGRRREAPGLVAYLAQSEAESGTRSIHGAPTTAPGWSTACL